MTTTTREDIARVVYDNSPVTFDDRIDGICFMSWQEAVERDAPHVRHAYTAADRILALIAGEGWRVVPVEPTQEMRKAATEVDVDTIIGPPTRLNWQEAAAIYAAMLAAAPTAEDAKEVG